MDEVVVRLVERDPGNLTRARGDPFSDQRGLAGAGWSRCEGQRVAVLQALVQPLEQTRTGHEVGARWRDTEFGG